MSFLRACSALWVKSVLAEFPFSVRRAVKEAVYHGFRLAGVPLAGARRLRGGLVVLTYHRFGTKSAAVLEDRVSLSVFRAQLRFVKRHFDVVRLDEGLASLEAARARGGRTRPMVSVTIDDGFAEVYYDAWPVLREEGVPFAVFLPTDFLDTGRPPWPSELALIISGSGGRLTLPSAHAPASAMTRKRRQEQLLSLKRELAVLPPDERFRRLDLLASEVGRRGARGELSPLSWHQVRELANAGALIGSHAVYHSRLTDINVQEALTELRLSKKRIQEETGQSVMAVAYPDGACSPEVSNLARCAGYSIGLTQVRGCNSAATDRLEMKRVQVPGGESVATFACRVTLTAW